MESETARNNAATGKIWDNFGFVKYPEKDLHKKQCTNTLCRMQLKYSGNTSNLADHLKRQPLCECQQIWFEVYFIQTFNMFLCTYYRFITAY